MTMPLDVLEDHAAACGEMSSGGPKSFPTIMEEKLSELKGKKEEFKIRVVRRLFQSTAIEKLGQATQEDWSNPVKVQFIGEDGVDAGGLTFEFFTLFFEKTNIFNNCGTFTVDAKMLEEKTYTIMGKLTAMAAIYGHPGPKALSAHLVTFILRGQEPTIEEISDNCFGEDVTNAIREISECSLDTAFDNNVALLEEAGFRKVLTNENKAMAISALKLHNGFYKFLGPIMQFMEGLKLYGVLEALKASSSDAEAILGISSSHTSADTVVDLFSPSYSADNEEKKNEEMVIYNFSNFLKKVERGQIETPWLNLDEPYNTKSVTINMGHVLQALLGCPRPPRNMTEGSGLIEFNHTDNRLSHVNTCAPSLCFAATRSLTSYNELEKHMIHIISDSDGFGLT